MDEKIKLYLERIGYEGEVRNDLDSLTKLMQCHMYSVPYENIDILNHVRLDLTIDGLYDKIVARHRGGYCFELNYLFGWLLGQLGFPVTEYFARFLFGEPEIPMRRHRVLKVECGGEFYLCDVGVGIELPRHPVKMVAETEQDGYKFLMDPFLGWSLQRYTHGKWEPYFSFTEEPQLPIDFAAASFYCEYAPESIFNKDYMIAIKDPGGRRTLDGNVFKKFSGNQVDVKELAPEEIPLVLRSEFGIHTAKACLGGDPIFSYQLKEQLF